ncbi:MAG: YdcF family protein, partial [Actinomycetota bacterium]|nr:YdcF family protein [Actinomycetota bacterium]
DAVFVLRWVTAPLRWAVKILVLLVAAAAVYYAVTLVQVWLTSRRYDPVSAQAIVVMGSAQYNGIPSPDLRARLDEALLLFQRGYAHLIVCTGSKEPGDAYTEAETGRAYLVGKGVPAADILEAGGRDTWTNLALAADLLRPRGDTDVLIVTDPFHEYRSMAVATDVGLTPHPTPTQTSPIKGTAVIPYFLRTAAAVALGRIVGFERLHALGELAVASASSFAAVPPSAAVQRRTASHAARTGPSAARVT